MGMYDCTFLFYIQFSFHFFAYALPVACRYNEIRGTGLLRGILNWLNRKKKKICTFNLFPLTGLHYIQCVLNGWCILSTVQEKLQSVAIQLVKSTVFSSFSPHKTENCSWQKPVRNRQRKTDDFSPNLLHCTRQKSHLTSNGKIAWLLLSSWVCRASLLFLNKLDHEWTAELDRELRSLSQPLI